MARLRDITVDCRHPASLARFWAGALDDHHVAPYDEAEIERLAALGLHDVEDDPTVLVEPAGGAGPRLFFQRVAEDKVTKNRVHLDLVADDVDAEIDRLVALGATVLARHLAPAGGTIVLADPEGNELCVSAAEPGPPVAPQTSAAPKATGSDSMP